MRLFGRQPESDPDVVRVLDAVERVERARQMGLLSRFPCLVCGCPTLPDRGGYSICSVCFWEDGGRSGIDEPSGPNHGYSQRRAIGNVVRLGTMYDEKDRRQPSGLDWRPALVVGRFAVTQALEALVAAPDDEAIRAAAAVITARVDRSESERDRLDEPVPPAGGAAPTDLTYQVRWSHLSDYRSEWEPDVTSLSTVTVAGRRLLVCAGADATMRLLDPTTGELVSVIDTMVASGVTAVCPITVDGLELLAVAQFERGIRLWDPATAAVARIVDDPFHEQRLCLIYADSRELLVSEDSSSTVRVWDPASGTLIRRIEVEHASLLCPITVAGWDVLAIRGLDGDVWFLDPVTGRRLGCLGEHVDMAAAACSAQVTGRPVLATQSDDSLELWDAAGGRRRHSLSGHRGPADVLCPVMFDGRPLLAGAGNQEVQFWDMATGDHIDLTIPLPAHEVHAMISLAPGELIIGGDIFAMSVVLDGVKAL